MHWLIVLGALIVWHGVMLLILWWLPLPPKLERYKPWLMGLGILVAVILVIRHAGLDA
jgi:hypothetical protein